MWERGREGNGEWEEIIGGVYHVEEERQGEREMRSGEETFYRWDKQEIDVETIEFFVLLHKENEEQFRKLENEYKGLPEILNQPSKAMNKPDNRIVVSHGRYMVDMFDGFFIGKAVKVVSEREKAFLLFII